MLDWLKEILGDAYSEDTDKKVSDQIGKDFVSRADFNAANEAKKQLEGQLKERDKQLTDLKKIDAEGLQTKIAELEAANAKMQKDADAAISKLKLDNAVDKALTAADAIQIKAVLPFLNMDNVKLADDGTISGLEEQVSKLKSDESTKFLFKEAKPPQFKGVLPGQGTDGIPNGNQGAFEARLAEARKNGQTQQAIAIKQEAAEQGIILM